MSQTPAWMAEVALLVTLLVVLGFLFVPAHRTSIWMDDEFTGYVAPISNRMADGLVLYGDGGHIPIPPLSIVLFHLASPADATWLRSSVWNYVFQSATLLVLYGTLMLLVRPPVPFLATLGAIPIFLTIGKTVLYDAFSQFLVALMMAAAVWALGLHRPGGRVRPGGIAMAGCVAAALVLSKQSTGIGAALGASGVFLLFPRDAHWRERLQRVGIFFASTGASFVVLCVLLSPLVSVRGMIMDVFLDGSEPKGGPARMLGNFKRYAKQLASTWQLYPAAAMAAIVYLLKRRKGPLLVRHEASHLRLVALAGMLLMMVVILVPLASAETLNLARWGLFSWTGFGLLMLAMAGALFQPPWRFDGMREQAMAAVGCIALPAAVFHSLSDVYFRWAYDNNPLVVLALAMLFALLLAVPAPRALGRALTPLLVFVISGLCWLGVHERAALAMEATERWPEVTHLAGARMRPSAEGMRELVAVVRRAAGPDDEVLLLPNDPNVEEWFERTRPPLSGPMVFTDQYWDRYVEPDFAALEANPPKLVVIGPRDYWRRFSRRWHPGWGAERLIDRVQQELLPQRYELLVAQPIRFQRGNDHMDVYVRADSPASGDYEAAGPSGWRKRNRTRPRSVEEIAKAIEPEPAPRPRSARF